MKLSPVVAMAALSLAACTALPGATGSPADHASHPPGTGAGMMAAGCDAPAMKRMDELHRKMQSATTPEERAALMNEHMKAMQDGMAAMERMRGPDGMGMGMGGMGMGGMHAGPAGAGAAAPAASAPGMGCMAGGGCMQGGMGMAMGMHAMMSCRIDMMEMMMRMMMDRDATRPPAAR